MRKSGFTLLEVLVATVIMAIAVTALLSSLSTSLYNAARLTAYDRAAMLARQKMDELLVATRLPKGAPLEGGWDTVPARWRAVISDSERKPEAGPGAPYLERIQLEISWTEAGRPRTFSLDAYRRATDQP
ncbi:MAG: type IV pilus modification PilV family protein [Bryobacteraceae bacterium]